MTQAKTGDTVRIHLTISLEDGTVFSSSERGDPIELKLGNEQIMPALEQAVVGMEEGATKKISLASADAFGERREDLVGRVAKSEFPDDVTPEVGMRLVVQSSDGERMDATVAEVTDDTVTLDGNHPLAGHEVTFEVTLAEVA